MRDRMMSPARVKISSKGIDAAEQIGDEPKTVGCTILYQMGNQTMEQLLDFPIPPR